MGPDTPAARPFPGARLLIATCCYVAATILASIVNNPTGPKALAPTPLLLATAAGIVGVLVTGAVSVRLTVSATARVVVLFALVYALETLTNWIEAVMFIRDTGALIPLSGAILAAGLAVPIGLLWRPDDTDGTVGAALKHTLGTRRWWSWAWRVLTLTVLWLPVYFVFVAADTPFVTRYYHETGTTFTIPSTGVLALAELIRGALHAVVLGAVAALLRRDSRRRTWFWLALTFSAYNAWLPLIQHVDWPYYLRAANLIEITCDGVVYGGLVALLLTARRSSPVEPSPAGPRPPGRGDSGVDVLRE